MTGIEILFCQIMCRFLLQLQVGIKEKWNQHIPSVPGGRKFSIRFPNSTKIECTIDKATPKLRVLQLVLSVG